MIAAAHFLALLSPGPDFFLIARTSLSSGWRVASGACLGIAAANAVFIIAAFAGTAALRRGQASGPCSCNPGGLRLPALSRRPVHPPPRR